MFNKKSIRSTEEPCCGYTSYTCASLYDMLPTTQQISQIPPQISLIVQNVENKKFFQYKKVIFHCPATIVYWEDGTKTVVKCSDKDEFDPEKAIAL